MSDQANIALIRAIQASWSDPDPETFPALFTDDGAFEDVAYGISIRGQEALRAHARRMKKHNVGLHIEVTTCDATAETGVAEWRLSHSFTGNFDGVDRTGVPIDIRGLSVYTFRDGRIARAADYWNYMEMIRAVGVIPRELRNFRVD